MKLVIMRHSTCAGLEKGIINGWLDLPLTKEADEKIEKVSSKIKEKFGEIHFDEAYSSYLSRTYFTAQKVLAKLNVACDVIQDIRLNERCYGKFQGMTRIEARKIGGFQTLSSYPFDITKKLDPMEDAEYMKLVKEYSQKLNICYKDTMKIVPRSESIEDVEKRVIEFSQEIVTSTNKDKNILVVGHANTVKLMTKYIENLSYEQTSKLLFAECGANIYDIQINTDKTFVVNNVYRINDEYRG